MKLTNNFQDLSFITKAEENGWEVFQFEDVLSDTTRQVKKIKKQDYLDEGLYPIVDQSKAMIGGYSNLKEGYYSDIPCIIFGDHTRIVKYIDRDIFIGADGVKVLKNKFAEDEVSTKFLFNFLKSVTIPDTGYNRHFKYLKEVIIPIPPIDVQLEIVTLLDTIDEIKSKKINQINALSTLEQSIVNTFIYE